MDRRQFLSTGSAAFGFGFVATTSGPALALVQPASGAGDAALNALFERIFQDRVRRYPDLATSLGLDKGANADLKSTLDVRPNAEARAEDLAILRRELASVQAVNPATLSPSAQLNRDVVS